MSSCEPGKSSLPNEDTSKNVPKKMFFVGHHSRNSSLNSFAGEEAEDCVELLPNIQASKGDGYSKGEEPCKRRCKVSGSCMCKLSVVFYLAVCILISALYVAFFGKNQAFFGDAWIPGKPTVHDKPTPHQVFFEDLPYTEWISQRWTYHDTTFATDWPSLPEEVDHIRQIVPGKVGGASGLWLLTESQLFFTRGITYRGLTQGATFENVSQQLDLEVSPDSYIIQKWGESHLYVMSAFNVTLLDCSLEECEVISTTCGDLLPFDSVLSACYSLSDNTLWLGTPQGLFMVYHDEDNCISFGNVSEVVGAVQTLAWRSVVTDDPQSKHPRMQPFFFEASVENVLQSVYATSNSADCATKGTAGYWQQRKASGFGVLVVGTGERLYFHNGKQWWFEWVSLWNPGLGGLVDGIPTALTFAPSGELYVANNVSLTRVNINYTFDRIGALEGLPYNQLTSLHVSSYAPTYPPLVGPSPPPSKLGTLWVGTTKGYTLFDIRSSKFIGYYYGPRWLPGGPVLSMVGSGSHTVVLTEDGVAVVHPELWTLSSKARHYQAMLERHTRDPGLVSDCPLANHTPSTCSPSYTDNDGLRTSWMVAAEAFRYMATKNPTARWNSWTLFSGMKFLVNVTDIDGLMARTVVTENSSVDGEDWHDSTSIPGWRWKGDTGSDEVVGHMWVYPLVYDIVAENEQQQQQVQDLLQDVVDYIKSNQYMLMDEGNCSTCWGVWSPSQLNLNQSWADNRGLNSLQILSYLLSAYRITNDDQFLQGFKELFSGVLEEVPTHYGLNMINQKINFPLDDSFSDDELAFLPYFLYYYSLKRMNKRQLEEVGETAQQFADLSIKRAWRSLRRGKSSAWTAIFAYITDGTHKSSLLSQLVWNLRTWPLELIEWSTTNSHRQDIRLHPEPDRHGRVGMQSVHVLPANERTQLRWNENPFLLDRPGSSTEMDPGPWLLPYWMARWSGML